MTTDRRSFLKAAAVGALAAPATVLAQSPESATRRRSKPDETGRIQPVSTGGLSQARLRRMHEVMAGHVASGRLPGLVTLISRRGETHVEAIGMKAFGGKDPMRRDTLFRIASVTKPITAAAAMILVEEAKLRLDDPVDRWLPELANRKVLKRIDSPLDDTVPAKRAITLRDLLTFRLGIGAVMVFPERYPIQKAMTEAGIAPSANMPSVPPDELMKRFGSLPLAHQPGEKWMYHSGSDILGVLIARATGKTLETFLRERIFAPLGMKNTAFSVPDSKVNRLATCYQTDFATGKVVVFDEARGGRFTRPPVFESGGGGLVSTIDDYLAFGRLMLNKGMHGREHILSRPSVELMTTDHITAEQKAASDFFPGFWDNRGWGFGMSVITRRDDLARSVGTFGWDGGYGTSWYADPKENMVGILMTQRVWDSPVAPAVNLDFWTSAYQAIDD
jgi:CubicO group peptidase (beta-lactamase class C family)